MEEKLRDDQIRIKVGVLAIDMGNECAGATEREIAFAHYGHDNLCIEIDNMTYSLGMNEIQAILILIARVKEKKQKRLIELENLNTRIGAAIRLGNITYLREENGMILFPSDCGKCKMLGNAAPCDECNNKHH